MFLPVDGRNKVTSTLEPGLPRSFFIASGIEMLRAFSPSILTKRSPDITPAS